MTWELNLGIVVIGRNEAARLPDCFRSIPGDVPIVYVDSGSQDSSLEIAKDFQILTVELSDDLPFSAARARNSGYEALARTIPAVQAVFFLDGDCVLDPSFLAEALPTLQCRPDCAIIVGQVEEKTAGENVFGLLAGLEWSATGPGEITDFNQLGGIMLIRAEDFCAVGGFDPDFIAGEDSELGIRLHMAGRRTLRIDRTMAYHAMDMVRFGQWWRRSVRAGHALAHRNAVHGKSDLRDCRSAFRSTLVYGFVLPFASLAGLMTIGLLGLTPLIAYAYLGWRFFYFYRAKGSAFPASVTGAAFGILAKFANAMGLVRYYLQRARRRFEIIEYK